MKKYVHTGLFIASLLVFQLQPIPASSAAANSVPQFVSDPNLAGGPDGHGSKLGPNDTIIIEAPVETSLPANPAGTAVCYSVNNQSPTPYFVPWNTPKEWSAFLSAVGASDQLSTLLALPATPDQSPWLTDISVSTCCVPQEAGEICTTQNKSIVSHDQLGYRYKGTPQGEQNNWGAQGDVYGPIYASNVDGDPNLTYRVTFVCSRGSWVKTHEEGSCVPVDGQCAAGVAGMSALPTDLTTLCAQGSVFGGLTNAGGVASPGPWTWTCLGTPGKANANCTSSAIKAECGAADGQPTGWTMPMANLCAGDAIASAPTGPDKNFFNGAGTTYIDNLWHWTCTPPDASAPPTECTALAGGTCSNNTWDWATGLTRPNAPDPTTEMLCDIGSPTPVIYGDNVWGFGTNKLWSWDCNAGGYTDHCQIFDSTSGELGDDDPQRSQCGLDAWGTLATTPTRLCNKGVSSVPWNDGTRWYWSCQSPRGTVYGCFAYLLLEGVCGSASGAPSATAPSSGLCSAGGPSNLTNNGVTWEWHCDALTPAFCSAPSTAPDPTTQPDSGAACGAANGSSTTTPPIFGLCASGTATAVVDNGSGQWVWSCQAGEETQSCMASTQGAETSPGPGICGPANNTAIPDQPNYNLCFSGAASIVTGSGPWSWSCTGTGNGVGTNASCSARFCRACSGSGTANITTAAISGAYLGCAVTGYASWTQTDGLGASNASARLQWTDPFYNIFTTMIAATTGPTDLCQPCYETAKSVANAQVTVKAAAGSCPGNGSLNSGNPVTITPNNITFTPQ